MVQTCVREGQWKYGGESTGGEGTLIGVEMEGKQRDGVTGGQRPVLSSERGK